MKCVERYPWTTIFVASIGIAELVLLTLRGGAL